jgi:[ribosomal protein S18]-alanine N-acetyltransferase
MAEEAEILIRPAGVQDLAAVSDLERRSFTQPWTPDSFQSLLGAERARFLVAVPGDSCREPDPGAGPEAGADPGAGRSAPSPILGYGVLWWASDQGELANLAVDPDARRRGVGSLLLDRLLAEAEAAGLSAVFLEVRASNAAAASLYEKRGFREVGVRRDYYSRPREDGRILRLKL